MFPLYAACLSAPEKPIATFAATVAISSGLQGNLYLLKPACEGLPNFNRMQSIGSIYATSLRVSTRSFQQGFPGVADRFEWFAIDPKSGGSSGANRAIALRFPNFELPRRSPFG